MFVDSVVLTLSAGKGGNGVIAWRREKYIPKGGPTGGNGGHGGSIFLKADNQTVSLEAYRNKRIICAESGGAGGPNLCQGKTGRKMTIKVPCGTLIKDKKTGEILFDLTENGQEVLLCKGGKGGKGNDHFKSPTHQAPHICTEGTPGESKEVELELKLIADVGLIGMPNAGKSTLLSSITYVPVKIGAYPFTTLHPNLGYAKCSTEFKLLIADIPGIIKNAHENKGLGISFLRHIERTSILIFVIDISGFEERDPIEDFLILREELYEYNKELLKKPFLVVLNKIDMEGSLENIERFRQKTNLPEDQIIEISAREKTGLTHLLNTLQLLAKAQNPIVEEELATSCN